MGVLSLRAAGALGWLIIRVENPFWAWRLLAVTPGFSPVDVSSSSPLPHDHEIGLQTWTKVP